MTNVMTEELNEEDALYLAFRLSLLKSSKQETIVHRGKRSKIRIEFVRKISATSSKVNGSEQRS